MPWTPKTLPPAAKNLSPAEKKLFCEVANGRLRAGASEGSAIRQGLAVAQQRARSKKG